MRMCMTAWVCACVQTIKTLPALAVVPPVGASPPSSSSASGSPAVCVCDRYAPSHILLHKSGSADTRHQHGSEPIPEPYLEICRDFLLHCEHISEQPRDATWWCSLPSNSSLSIKQIFPWQQWVDISSALITSEMVFFFFLMPCLREQPTWHLSASSCSFRSCTSCRESPSAPSGVLLLWLFPCHSASGLEEAGKKEGEGLYPETWLCDRLGPPGGLLVEHDAGSRITALKLPFSKDIRQKDKWCWQPDNIDTFEREQTDQVYTV